MFCILLRCFCLNCSSRFQSNGIPQRRVIRLCGALWVVELTEMNAISLKIIEFLKQELCWRNYGRHFELRAEFLAIFDRTDSSGWSRNRADFDGGGHFAVLRPLGFVGFVGFCWVLLGSVLFAKNGGFLSFNWVFIEWKFNVARLWFDVLMGKMPIVNWLTFFVRERLTAVD